MTAHTRTLPAFPSHGSMGEVVSPGMSIAMLMTAHAMQGLIAGTVARNGAQALHDDDAQGELAEMAVSLSDRVISAVNTELERERWDWTQRVAARRLEALKRLHAVATSMHAASLHAGMSGGAQEAFAVAVAEANDAIEDDDIPF